MGAGWTHITRLQNDYLLFYNSTTGDSSYGKLIDNPNVDKISFTRQPNFKLGPNWTNFAATSKGILLEYNSANGIMLVVRANIQTNDYVFVNGDPIIGSSGWKFVLAIR